MRPPRALALCAGWCREMQAIHAAVAPRQRPCTAHERTWHASRGRPGLGSSPWSTGIAVQDSRAGAVRRHFRTRAGCAGTSARWSVQRHETPPAETATAETATRPTRTTCCEDTAASPLADCDRWRGQGRTGRNKLACLLVAAQTGCAAWVSSPKQACVPLIARCPRLPAASDRGPCPSRFKAPSTTISY